MGRDKWLNCRLVDIQKRLDDLGHRVSKPVIGRLLRAHDYHLRANVKQDGGSHHPDRDRQFCYIREQQARFLAQDLPVISVDTKKGINRPAVTSNNQFLGQRRWKAVEGRYFRLTRALQKKGSRSAKRHLRKAKRRRARFRRDADHVLSKHSR
jgi:hypothetical protein